MITVIKKFLAERVTKMRRVFKKTIVIVLSLLLLLSLLPMTALADDDPAYPTIAVGDTKKITPEEADDGMVYYQFTPTETGWYALDSSEEESRNLYAHLSVLERGEWLLYGTWGSNNEGHIHLVYRFKEGTTYRFDLECDGMSGPYSVTLNRPETYTIRFHAGDGFFYDWNTGTQKDVYEDQFPLNSYIDTITTPQSNVDGMRFTGWATNPDATIPEFDSWTYQITGDADLYAVYGKQITVKYDANGGYFPFGDDKPETYELTQGAGTAFSNYGVEYPDDSKIFAGWFTEKEGGEQYTYEDRVMDDLTVYAHWEVPVTVTYDANGGTFTGMVEGTTYTQKFKKGDPIYFIGAPKHPDPDMQFRGYYTEKEGGECVSNGEYYVTKDMTVYAQWEKRIMVTYDANGGYFYGDENQTQVTYSFSVDDSSFYSPTPTSKDPTKVLDGWFSKKEGGQEYKTNDPLPGSMTVYAHWIKGTPITYDANGGTFSNEETTQTIYYKPGTMNTIYSDSPKNSNPKKVFIGWATTKDATQAEYSRYQRIKVDNFSTLYAVYSDGIKITEQAGDGYFWGNYDSETGQQEKKKSIEFYVPVGATVGSLFYYYSGVYGSNGYIRAYTDQERKGDFNYRSLTPNGSVLDSSYVLTADTTLYVLWKDTAIITFDAGDGRFSGAASSTPITTMTSVREIGVEHPINYMESFTPVSNDSSKAFLGWSESGKEADIVTSITPERDMTMKAVYKAGYKVTFESNITGSYWVRLNGQYCGTGSGSTAVWPSGIPYQDLDLRSNANGQYIFQGFSTTKDGKNLINDNWYPTKDTTLYAIFMEGNEVYLETDSGYFQSTGNTYLIRQVPKGQALGTVETPVSPGMVFTGWLNWETQEMVDPKTFVPTDFTELVAVWEKGDQKYEWVTKGVNKNYTGLAKEKSGTWYYLKNGEPDFSYTGVEKNESGWWRVEKGIVNFKFNGLAANKNGTWYLKNGKVDFNYTGFAAGVAKNESGWWYVEGGQVKFNKTDIIKGVANYEAGKAGTEGWWYVINSKVNGGNTVAKNANGWWVIRGGKVDFNYTGFAANANGWWYAESGKVKFDKNDVIKGTANNDASKAGEEGWWLVRGSKVTKATTVAKNSNGWWRIEDGMVNFKYNGVAKNEYGWWYLKDGKVNFGYTGFGSNENGWWYVENGQVKFNKNDVIKGVANNEAGKAGEEGWWLVKGSKVSKETTVAKNSNGWWRIEDGKVNFKYNGLGTNQYGTWYIKDGKVDFSYSGTYEGKKIVNGKVQ